MEYFVNNSHKNRIEIAGFVRQALRNRPATNSLIGSWSEVSEEDGKTNWDDIIFRLSQIEGCKKIIKTISNGEEFILFLCEDTSTKNIRKINKEYSKLLDDIDVYFGLLVLNESEFECWKDNDNNIVYWENNA